MDDDLLSIGRFARLSGLTVGALRHYDELDLIRPVFVDPDTGYRWYRRAQLEIARTIVRLRDLEMPLDEIREVLAADDAKARRSRIAAHRGRIEARTYRLQRVLHQLDRHVQGKEPIVSQPPLPPDLDAATRRALAVGLFNHVWRLLETTDRTIDQDDEMIHATHASRYHWGEVGEPVNRARGEWQCSRVYAVLGRAEPALHHAQRCVAILEEHGIADWDRAAAYEAMARALAVGGDLSAAAEWKRKAREALDGIEETDDREVVEQDLATIP